MTFLKKSWHIAWRMVLFGGLFGLVCTLGLALGTAYVVHNAAERLPTFQQIRHSPSGTTVRYLATDGSLLFSKGPAYGEWMKYSEIPANMRHAILAIEDQRYRQHYGVDPVALGRAVKFAYDNRGGGKRLQGASTITQQVARTLFLNQRYDIRRKLDEMIVALAMEQRLSKDQILELYLNRIYFGGGAYGIDAASRKFFGHGADELTKAEAAMIAGVARAPSNYSPTADREAAIGRMKVVLGAMRSTGQDKNAPINPEIKIADAKDSENIEARTNSRHFVDWIAPQLDQIAPGLTGNVDVYTTLNPSLQEDAQAAVAQNVPSNAQGALVSMEDDGAIRAMVGGLDYQKSNYNRATEARRQPGSSFKLFVYLAALEAGYKPNSAVYDAPISIGPWHPQNDSGRYSGTIALKDAFAFSLNSVAARLGLTVGVKRISEMAQRLGVSTPLDVNPSIVLGTSDVRLIDMTRSYAAVSAKGLSVVPYGIQKIVENDIPVYIHDNGERQQVLSEDVSSNMTLLMSGTVEKGTGRAADIGRPTAGKTGTTTSNKDGWFVGFSSGLVTGVWMGRDDAKPVPGLQGGRAPAKAFSAYMSKAVEGRPITVFTKPDITTQNPSLDPDAENDAGSGKAPDKLDNASSRLTSAPASTTEEIPAPRPAPRPAPPERQETINNEASPGRSRAIRPDQ